MNKQDQRIKDELFYTQIGVAMNSARIIKTIILLNTEKVTNTQIQILRSSYIAMIINTAKLWDNKSYNLKKFVDRKNITENERLHLIKQVEELALKYNALINQVTKIRNTIVAHLDKKITVEQFKEAETQIDGLQQMLNGIKAILEKVSWNVKDSVTFLDYTQIKNELNV